jgi:hypothetical protein
MTTVACVDYRRTDQRTNVLENPFWITSGLVSGVAVEDKGTLLFSFPNSGRVIFINEVLVQVVAALTAGTTIDVGYGTIATEGAVTGDNITYTATSNSFITNTDIGVVANTVYGATSGTGSTWLTLKASGAYTVPRRMIGVASTGPVPCIFALVANAATVLAGTFRVHMLITTLPGT